MLNQLSGWPGFFPLTLQAAPRNFPRAFIHRMLWEASIVALFVAAEGLRPSESRLGFLENLGASGTMR